MERSNVSLPLRSDTCVLCKSKTLLEQNLKVKHRLRQKAPTSNATDDLPAFSSITKNKATFLNVVLCRKTQSVENNRRRRKMIGDISKLGRSSFSTNDLMIFEYKSLTSIYTVVSARLPSHTDKTIACVISKYLYVLQLRIVKSLTSLTTCLHSCNNRFIRLSDFFRMGHSSGGKKEWALNTSYGRKIILIC